MTGYLITFLVTLAAGGAVMAAMNRSTSDRIFKRRGWRLAFAASLGITLADIVTDIFHPPYGRIVRALIVGAAICITTLLMERFFAPKQPRSPQQDAPPVEPD